MAKYQLLLPKMGESVAEATIIKWNKNPGDYIEADEAVMEIATDKVDSEVPSPVSGKLIEQLCREDEVVQVGSVIAIIETDAADEQPSSVPVQQGPEVKSEPIPAISKPVEIPGISQLEQAQSAPAASGVKHEKRFYSPLVKDTRYRRRRPFNKR
jgi:2-oxoglutarate dehydrogenase E2 component (dihydrolipoamide succinyltransferase)